MNACNAKQGSNVTDIQLWQALPGLPSQQAQHRGRKDIQLWQALQALQAEQAELRLRREKKGREEKNYNEKSFLARHWMQDPLAQQ